MNFSDEILDLKYQLDDVFGTESDDMVDEYDELGTEATVKGSIKKASNFVLSIGRKIVDLIMRWIRNRSINKLVGYLKNKVAKYTGKDQLSALLQLLKVACKTGTKSGSEGPGNETAGRLAFVVLLVTKFNSNDQLVRLNAINRQIKGIPVDKFGKTLKSLKETIGKDTIKRVKKTGVTQYTADDDVFGAIGGKGDIVEAYASLLATLIGDNNPSSNLDSVAKRIMTVNLWNTNHNIKNAAAYKDRKKMVELTPDGEQVAALTGLNKVNLTKGNCDTIGKTLKALMACLSSFTLKTMDFYGRNEDQWLMTGNQKAIIKILKDTQKAVYTTISTTNNLFVDVKTDDFEEKDEDWNEESVDMSDELMEMMITSESLSNEIANIPEMDDEYFNF